MIIKKIMIGILTVLSMCLFLGFFGCDSVPEAPEDDPETVVITLSSDTLYVQKGTSETLTYTAINGEGKSITWSSSNISVCTVSNGVVTGVNAGTAKVSLQIGTFSSSCDITVFSSYQNETGSEITTPFEVYKRRSEGVLYANDLSIVLQNYGLTYDPNTEITICKGSLTSTVKARFSLDKKKLHIGGLGFGPSIYGTGVTVKIQAGTKIVTIPLSMVVTKYIREKDDLDNMFYYGGMQESCEPLESFSDNLNKYISSKVFKYVDMTDSDIDTFVEEIRSEVEANTSLENFDKSNLMEELNKPLLKNTLKNEDNKQLIKDYLFKVYDGYFVQANTIDLNGDRLENRDLSTYLDNPVFIDSDYPTQKGTRSMGTISGYWNIDVGFIGTYDGQGNSILNMGMYNYNTSNPNAFNGNRGGVFGNISTKGVVKNLGVTACNTWVRFSYNRMFVLAASINGTLDNIYTSVTVDDYNPLSSGVTPSTAYFALAWVISGAKLSNIVTEFHVTDIIVNASKGTNLRDMFADYSPNAIGYYGLSVTTRQSKNTNTYKNCYFFYDKLNDREPANAMSSFECYSLDSVPDKTFAFDEPSYWDSSSGHPIFNGC